MERMNKGDLLHIGTAYVEVHTFKGKDYVTVKDFSTTTNALSKEILELEQENKELKKEREMLIEDLSSDKELQQQIAQKQLDYYRENEKLRAENEYLHKLLPEADGYVIEKQLEKRVRNDGEEDVYE